MVTDEQSAHRATFVDLVTATSHRPGTHEAVFAELKGQLAYELEPSEEGLDELAALLLPRLAGYRTPPTGDIARLHVAFARQPLWHLYGFALRREVGDHEAARHSLDRLLAIDPSDPMAVYLDAHLRGEEVVAATEEVRLANIAKFAATPLLKNPYELAVGAIFEAIRERERARVLDVGIGGGAQMSALIGLLARHPHAVRRLEIVGLDFMPDFLAAAGQRIAKAAESLAGAVEVTYQPIDAHVERLDEPTCLAIVGAGLHAANATIALHEVPGERKLAALRGLRRLSPGLLVIAEWNYCLENLMPETSTEFVFNIRRVAAAMVAALRERHPLQEARAVVRDWLSQAGGQLTCAADRRQECFLDVASWRALLEHSGFKVVPVEDAWLDHAEHARQAAIASEGWYIETSRYASGVPIALLAAV